MISSGSPVHKSQDALPRVASCFSEGPLAPPCHSAALARRREQASPRSSSPRWENAKRPADFADIVVVPHEIPR
jgi:hypothetical protein